MLMISAAVCAALGTGTAMAQDGRFIQTAHTPSFETDFTVAAEKTVNSVVCIQSYETPRQQQYFNPFGDFFDFFGGQISSSNSDIICDSKQTFNFIGEN